jgi:microcin C transport system substrate-binding protein
VRFTFKHGNNRELSLILGQFPITSKAFYQKHDITKPGMLVPMGSGPYDVASAVPGKNIRYKRRDDYWAKNLPINRGRYNFDTIHIDYYRDETVAIEALKAGEYDFRQENIARLWAKAYDTPAVKSGRLKKEEIAHKIPTGMQGFLFNLRKDKFKNRLTRKAIALAFNFEWANQNLFYGGYHRTLSYFSNSDLASSGLPSAAERILLDPWKKQLPPELFNAPFSLPVNNAPADMRDNLIKAKELLMRAGWLVKDGKLVDGRTGEPFTIEFLIEMPSMERVLASLVQNLRRLGIDARIRMVDSAQYQKREEQFDFDMITTVIPQSMSPGNEQIDYWHSSKANVQGSRNLAGLQNPAVDAMVEAIVAAPNRAALVNATHALDRILLSEYIAIPGWHLKSFRIVYWDKFERPAKRPDYGLGFPHTWWSKPAK